MRCSKRVSHFPYMISRQTIRRASSLTRSTQRPIERRRLGQGRQLGKLRGPHLHFHVSQIFDTQNASGLNGSALPIVFEAFELLDGEGASTGTRTLAIPVNEALTAFP